MKGLKGNYGFYISVGILGLAIAGSAFFWKREADKAKRLKADVTKWKENVNAVRLAKPTEEHRQHLEGQRVKVEETYKQIVMQALEWNHVPEKVSGLKFQGEMNETIGLIEATARINNQIRIAPKARYLGFEEYALAPPGPDDDVLQLQREFSAAVDIARLLIASDVYSIDRMVRRDDALMEAGTSSSRYKFTPGETTTRRRSGRYDFYDTVPFRVQFSCTYPSLAFFQNSLITPNRVGQEGLPKNFFVVNDLRFKVKEADDEREKMRRDAMDRALTVTRARAGRKGLSFRPEDIPEDLPGAQAMLDMYGHAALSFFRQWRTKTPEEKEIWRLQRRLGEQISTDAREELSAQLARMKRELDNRKRLKGRPPEYSIIEVNMLIDFVEFNDKLKTELEPEKAKTARSASSISTASR
ncbi:hypothetical protein HQ563_00665 [bacterium]|nr:hypothetical protein [bacterium]